MTTHDEPGNAVEQADSTMPKIGVMSAAMIGLTTLLVGFGAGALVIELASDPAPTQSTSETETIYVAAPGAPVTTAARPSPTTIPGDGVFGVGNEVQPGTYWSRPAGGSHDCYWARRRGFSGTTEGIIANDRTRGPAYVTITPTDVGFQTDGCQVWQKVG